MNAQTKYLVQLNPRHLRFTAKQQLALDSATEGLKYAGPYNEAAVRHAAGVIHNVCFSMVSVKVTNGKLSSP